MQEAFDAHGYAVMPSGCWHWNGVVGAHGYGVVWIGGRQGNNRRAHRISLELSGVPVGPDDFVRHSCDNPLCVNPAHLSVGTPAQNTADMWQRGRGLAGDKHPHRIRGNPLKGRGGPDHPLYGRRRAICRRGHPMTPENSIRQKDGTNRCRACREASNSRFTGEE
jgi:hypothetical protein